MKLFQIKMLNVWYVWIRLFFSSKAMIPDKDYDVQRTVRSIHRDGRSREKPVNNRIKIILTMNINETLSEDKHKIHGCNQELCNRAIHKFMH